MEVCDTPLLKDVWPLTTWFRTPSRKLFGFADSAAVTDRTGVGHDKAITVLREAEQHAWVRQDALPPSKVVRTRESSASSTR